MKIFSAWSSDISSEAGLGPHGRLQSEIHRGDVPALGHQDRALDGVAELADVAGPEMRLERLPRRPIEAFERPPVSFAETREVMLGEREDVLAPLPQPRQVNDDGVQPVQQILAEPSRGDLRPTDRRWSPRSRGR